MLREGPNRVPDKIATGARAFLKLFFIFFTGFAVAHLDSVQRIEKGLFTGDLADTVLSNRNDSYDKDMMVWSSMTHGLLGGAVLLGPEFSRELALTLVDEEGHILHRWHIESGLFNPDIKAWWKDLPIHEESSVDDAHLLPNGDVVFIQGLMSVNNYRGQRLARMDKDSHILWQVPGNFHHFINIAGSPQKIYALTSGLREGFPEVAQPNNLVRYLEDYVEVYSLDGKKLDKFSLADAFENSPYRKWLSSFEINIPLVQRIQQPDGRVLYDLFHVNSVQYLDAQKAKALPQAKEGDILISFRTMNAVAVMRPSTNKIVWAAKGPWRHQHNAQVGDDGKLYIFDNEGRSAVTLYQGWGPPEQYISRLVTYDPATDRLDEIYASPLLYTYFLGDYQHLPNDSWIISSPLGGRVLVVSHDKEIVWQLRTVPTRTREFIPHRKQFSFMHYYPPSVLKFLSAQKDESP